jgi:hypothetical protein
VTDFCAALARLLSEPSLRETFARDRAGTLDVLQVRAEDRWMFTSLDVDALQAQAETLLEKRRSEARPWIPRTWRRLGLDADALFREYALESWPPGPRRPLIDALSFCRKLRRNGDGRVCRIEDNRLQFVAGRRRWSLHMFRTAEVAGRRRTVLQLLVRRHSGTPLERVFYLGLLP